MSQVVLSSWKSRIAAAMAAASGLRAARFCTSLQDRHEFNAPYHDHTGFPVEIVGLVVAPGNGYDEESLPFFKGRFDDGVELDIFAEEISTENPAVQGLIDAVCSGFAVARDMGYMGPYHLADEGSAEELRRFMREDLLHQTQAG